MRGSRDVRAASQTEGSRLDAPLPRCPIGRRPSKALEGPRRPGDVAERQPVLRDEGRAQKKQVSWLVHGRLDEA